MKRREFSQTVLGLGLVGGAWLGIAAPAQAFSAGDDYMVVDPAAPVDAPAGKIEVVEFFAYGCPHCHAFDPTLNNWLKQLPRDVVFRRNPVSFNAIFAMQQRMFYALEALGVGDKLHSSIFDAIHVKRIKLTTPEEIANWVASQGVDRQKFIAQFTNSFDVDRKCKKATALQNSYKVEGVPALGVAGRYWTDVVTANGPERALQVVSALVAQVRNKK